MDQYEELERMALNAESCDLMETDAEPCNDQIERWRKLFHYSEIDAIEKIKQQRLNLSRVTISDNHWDLVRERIEAEGFDRKSYEHSLQISGLTPARLHSTDAAGTTQAKSQAFWTASFVFKLEGILSKPQYIQRLLGTDAALDIRQGSGEDGEASFCRVDFSTKTAIEVELAKQRISYRPIFIRESLARKDFSGSSAYPTLGQDSTLPHHRPQYDGHTFLPTQDQYPVWYFFYGTLADKAVLSKQLDVPIESLSAMEPARISGGTIQTWSGKYRALVDGPSSSTVDGTAYELRSREHEQALRLYETSIYEVVRCNILMEGGKQEVKGCTFRFVG